MSNIPIYTKYDGFNLKNNDWFRHLTRDLSLIIVYYTESAYIYCFKKLGAKPLDEIIYESKKGILNIWRPENSFNKTIESIQEKFRKNPDWVLKKLKKLRQIEEKTEKFCRSPLRDMNQKKKIGFLAKIHDIFEDYLTYYMFLVCFGYGFKEEDRLKFKEIAEIFEKLKQNTLFKIMEKRYIDFGKMIFDKDGEFVVYLTFQELKDMIKNSKLDITLAKKRFERCVFYGSAERKYILSGKDAEIVYEKLIKKRKKENSDGDIKGTSAYRGKVIGKVFIAITEKDYRNIREDDILVTPTTTPWLIPYIGKIKGIVADEGGLTSHAAIISREKEVPCIVGAKGATEKLKTGDTIELDAYKGTVRKIR